MPTITRLTGTSDGIHGMRILHGDEHYVVETYQLHVDHCHECVCPLRPYGLCEQGILLAHDIFKYLYKWDGRYFAVNSHCYDKTNEVELPRRAFAVRNLLAAVDSGMPLLPPHATSHDTPRRRPRYTIDIIERRPCSSIPSHRIVNYYPLWLTEPSYLQCKLQMKGSSPILSNLMARPSCTSRKSAVWIEIRTTN